ncbi:bacteriophage antitermination protein Q [Phytobacter diazotrophicus]|uniref:bacteriophage antitermination protein Q n=1 Tax=Phytobacter diazotrophicus TaxID=395631 RepID=UPI002FF1E9EF
MNEQYLQYVREEIALATADFSGRTKGQLVALVEQLQFTHERYPRKRQFIVDEVTGKKIMLRNPPVPGKQSHAKGTSIPQVIPVEFSTASWRRAIAKLEDAESAWVKWNYLHETDFSLQTVIVQHGWQLFSEMIKGRRIAGKTKEKLKALIWLAAQDVKEQLSRRESYQFADLAALVGVADSTWTETYKPHWLAMARIFFALDKQSLISICRSRSQQKTTNLHASLAKPN